MRKIIICLFLIATSSPVWSNDDFQVPEYREGISSFAGMRITVSQGGLKKPFAHTSFWAKVDDEGEPMLDQLYVSSASEKGNIYLFDFAPSDYVLVAALFGKKGRAPYSNFHYLDKASAINTKISIENGKALFAGRITLNVDRELMRYSIDDGVLRGRTGARSNRLKNGFRKSVQELIEDQAFASNVAAKITQTHAENNQHPHIPKPGSAGAQKTELRRVDYKAGNYIKYAKAYFKDSRWTEFVIGSLDNG